MTKSRHAPTAKSLKFSLDGSPADYSYKDDRSYTVLHRGYIIGTVEVDWMLADTEGAEPVKGWGFRGSDGSHGQGKTRAAAVLDAYRDETAEIMAEFNQPAGRYESIAHLVSVQGADAVRARLARTVAS